MRMRYMIAGLFVAVVLASTVASASVKWSEDSFSQVLARARQENKHVFIDFYTTWCGPCKRLEEATYPAPAVTELLNAMIPVKYDAEKGVGIELAKQYKVRAYPTLIVLDPSGHEIDRYLGFMPPEPFVEVIDGYRKGVGTIAELSDKLRKSPDDLDLLYKVGMKHAEAGRAGDASAVLTHAMELDPQDTKGRNAELLYAMGEAYYNDDRYADARPYFERLAKEYSQSEMYDDGLKRLAATQFKLGEKDAAVATYWKAVEPSKDDPTALNGFAWFCAQRKIGLDKAVKVAEEAAKISNRDPGILDTLAEVYFARGEYNDAIRVGEEALAKEPNDQYFKDQVEKFKKAKAEADQAKR